MDGNQEQRCRLRLTRSTCQRPLPASRLAFTPPKIKEIRSLGSGNVNDTYLVTHGASRGGAFVLQKLNTHVFARPDLVMQSEALGNHVQRRRQARHRS